MLKKIKTLLSVIRSKIKIKDFYFYQGNDKLDLLIYDNIYPHPISGFRLEEFTILLSKFRNSKIIVHPNSYPILKTPISKHKEHITNWIKIHPDLSQKISRKKGRININTKLFYCVFISNIYDNLNWLEKYQIPFVFTLYPGGGFRIDDSIVDEKLRKVFNSPMFRKVIVTQNFTKEYLERKGFCSPEQIKFIFGVVVPQHSIINNLANKRYYLKDKTTFDICFCAAKYTPKGEDKGYDIFIDFAIRIASKFDFIKFHIIGGFNEDVIDVSPIKEKINFYGYQDFDNLHSIFLDMDVFISPNRPYVLKKGAFDGFPLGTVVEAALSGVVCLLTDSLDQNNSFKNNEDLIIIDANVNSIEKEIIDLILYPEKLYTIAESGRAKFRKIYSNQNQMQGRIDLLRKEIADINQSPITIPSPEVYESTTYS